MPQRRRQGHLDDAFAGAETIGPPVAGQSDLPTTNPDEPLSGNFADLLLSLFSPIVDDPLGAITGGAGGAMQAAVKILGRAGRTPGWFREPTKQSMRIPKNQQHIWAVGTDAASKIPRFRSPAGDFVKFEEKWWRIKPFRQDATDIELEWLGPGAHTVNAKVLEARRLPMTDFYASVLASKAAKTPKRRK